MKRFIALALVIVLSIHIAQAQDQDTGYKLNADVCKPSYMLPDHDPSVSNYDDKNYTNEQLAMFCITVSDQLGAIQTDPHLDNIVISATDATGALVPLVHPAYKEQLPGDFPYEIVLVLDASGSMSQSIRQMRRAALNAIRSSQLPDPYYAVMAFNTKTELQVGLTQNDQRIESAINAVQPKTGSYTCLYDAVDDAIKLTAANARSRRVIILFTDGKNEDKEGICKITKPDSVIKDAQLNGTSIFAVGLEGSSGVDKKQLDSLTQQSNGTAQYGGSETLPTLFEAILRRLYSMRVMTALICGQGAVTLTMQANIDGKPALPTSTILNLDNTQCVPPAPTIEATAPLAPTQLPDPIADVVRFDIQPDSEAHDIASFTVNFANRADIISLKANLRDSENKDAVSAAQDCASSKGIPGKFDCRLDVTALKPGKLTLLLNPYASDGSLLTQQPIVKDYSKEDIQPQLETESDGENLVVSVKYPVPVTSAVLTVRSSAGIAFPVPGTFSGGGPYQLAIENVDVDSIIVQAELQYGKTTRTIVSDPIVLQRSFIQQVGLFLRVNGLLVGAILALGVMATAWLLWRRRGGPSTKEDDWLGSPVPDATKVYSQPSAPPVANDAATKIYNSKAAIGELEIVRLTTDTARQGSKLVVKSPFTIGRATTCDLTIQDDFLSRTHLTIVQQDGITFIKDMGSSNGTILSGQPLAAQKEVMLKDGAEIVLGDGITLRYRSKQEMLTRMMSSTS